jgi:hypothetical protein
MAEFAAWDSFYVIVGSAAGALIGLQFVVMTLLIADMQRRRTPEAGAAFATPICSHGALRGLAMSMGQNCSKPANMAL